MFAKFVEFLLTFLTLQGITGLFEESTDISVLQKIDEMDQEIQSLKKKVSHLESESSLVPVAFMATITNTLHNVGTHQHIVFDKVITNVGSGYKASTGHFIAPRAGVYAFFVALTNTPQHSASAVLYRNGKWIGHVLAHGTATNTDLYVTSTLPCVVTLFAGDEVWVQNEYEYTAVETIDGYNWSYFTGYLVNAK